MEIKFDKECVREYLTFIISVVLFVLAMAHLTYSYLTFENGKAKDPYAIEINLPIIEWQKYSSLSKIEQVDRMVEGQK